MGEITKEFVHWPVNSRGAEIGDRHSHFTSMTTPSSPLFLEMQSREPDFHSSFQEMGSMSAEHQSRLTPFGSDLMSQSQFDVNIDVRPTGNEE
jgi:hypothetical protein